MVIDLSIKRGNTSLSILKAEKRGFDHLDKPCSYWTRDLTVTFEGESGTARPIDLGSRLKDIRTRKRISQTELAKFVGVTPSTISQVGKQSDLPVTAGLAQDGRSACRRCERVLSGTVRRYRACGVFGHFGCGNPAGSSS